MPVSAQLQVVDTHGWESTFDFDVLSKGNTEMAHVNTKARGLAPCFGAGRDDGGREMSSHRVCLDSLGLYLLMIWS